MTRLILLSPTYSQAYAARAAAVLPEPPKSDDQ